MRSYPLTFTAATFLPAWVIRLTRQDGTILRIADTNESIVVGAETFVPLPGCETFAVKHVVGAEVPSTEIKFAHSVGGTIDTTALNRGLWDGATVQIYPVDRENITALGDALFTGTVQPITISPIGKSASFDCRGHSARAESVIQTYSPMCRTDLFSDLCQLTAASFDHAGTIGSIIDRFTVTIAGLASPPADGWFNQGVGVAASGLKFEIANWTLSTLRLTTYLPVCMLFTVSEAVTIYPGCDKTIGANGCGKFSNWTNFQGEPHFRGAAALLEG